MLKQLNLQFSETFPSDIWETALSGEYLLIGCREGDKMEATFSLYDLKQHNFLWKSISFDESWWVSIYAFVDNIIVFQIFNDSQNIEARSLFGFEITRMEAVWSVDNVNVLGLSGQVLKLKSQETENDFFKIDITTGEEIKLDSEKLDQENVSNGIILPFHYTEENPYFQTVKQFLAEFADLHLVGACDYLEYNGLILISAHEKLEQNLSNTIVVFDGSGNLILKEVLAEQSKGLASDTFYIVNEQLIFVKEKREMKGYLIENL
ncbi:MAG: hypothetical protein ACI9Z3_001749 [Roseivirga sp.]